MKRLNVLLILLVFLVLVSTNGYAMQRAGVNQNDFSLTYNVQFWEDNIKALNFEGDLGLTETIGVQTIFTYGDNGEYYLDNNIKFRISEDNQTKVSGIIGHHTDFETASYPRFGVLITNSLGRYLNLNAGVDFLRDHPNDLGFAVGFDYYISRNLEFEAGYRQLSGQSSGGFVVGFRHNL